jgi:hypothetical protein
VRVEGNRASPPCRHFKHQSCFRLGSAFEVALFPKHPSWRSSTQAAAEKAAAEAEAARAQAETEAKAAAEKAAAEVKSGFDGEVVRLRFRFSSDDRAFSPTSLNRGVCR